MADRWFGIIFGTLMLLTGFVQAWRPGDAVRIGDGVVFKLSRLDCSRLRPDWLNKPWLFRLIGVIGALVGLGILIASLQSA